jgi:hypothetical protein
MIRNRLLVALALALVVGCGGNSPSAGDEPEREQPGAGGGGTSGSGANAGNSGGAQAGEGGTSEPGIGGGCTKVCVPTASFVLSSPTSAEALRSGHLKACRNGEQECFQGELPPLSGGNAVSFEGAQMWNGPSAFSVDEWQTLRFSWSGLGATPPLADGDRFTLTWEGEDESVTLLDKVVDFETVVDCSGSCLNASFELNGEPQGESGAGGEAGASADAGAGGQGGARSAE